MSKPRPAKPGVAAVTSRHIAAHTGVSQTTVSLVLNGRADAYRISDRTKRRIRSAARKLGYQSNYLARGLKGASTRSVGLIWSLISTPHSAMLVSELSRRISGRGYVCYVADLFRDAATTVATLRDFRQRRVDAVVIHATPDMFADTRVEAELEAFPAALIVSDREHPAPHDMVVHDRLDAYRQVADHFVAIGRRAPVIIGNVASNQTKILAFTGRLRERGVRIGSRSVIDVPARGDQIIMQDCYDALEALFPSGAPPFDAAMCTNDELAVTVRAWLRGRNVRVPQDVALVGFDNTQSAAFCDPPLASVERCDQDVAEWVERTLFARLSDPDMPPQRQRIAMRFVHRGSAG